MLRGIGLGALVLFAAACSAGAKPGGAGGSGANPGSPVSIVNTGSAGSGENADASASGPVVLPDCPIIAGISAVTLSAPVGGSLQVEAIPTHLGPNHTFTFAWREGASPSIGEIADP